ncbi:hypothetical protein OKW43_004653 [Paraburkholderia sp. WC7.3g]|uniref:MFS transporter n=1 Tax=Paraburkholderia sp. WC7.3g TaxID=2991070 RepID=UPI003D2412DA
MRNQPKDGVDRRDFMKTAMALVGASTALVTQVGPAHAQGANAPAAGAATGARQRTLYTGDVIDGKKVINALDVDDLPRGAKHMFYFQGVQMPTGLTVAAACVIGLSRGYWPIAFAQIATAVAGSVMGTALMGLSLGMTGRRNFDRQYGRNQVANHAGNIAAAALSGAIGWWLGIVWVFALGAAFGLACIASVLLIPARAVHRHYARGLAHEDDTDRSQVRAHSIRAWEPRAAA